MINKTILAQISYNDYELIQSNLRLQYINQCINYLKQFDLFKNHYNDQSLQYIAQYMNLRQYNGNESLNHIQHQLNQQIFFFIVNDQVNIDITIDLDILIKKFYTYPISNKQWQINQVVTMKNILCNFLIENNHQHIYGINSLFNQVNDYNLTIKSTTDKFIYLTIEKRYFIYIYQEIFIQYCQEIINKQRQSIKNYIQQLYPNYHLIIKSHQSS